MTQFFKKHINLSALMELKTMFKQIPNFEALMYIRNIRKILNLPKNILLL